MKKFVQIVDNTAYWIFDAEELPPYPNVEDFLEITGRNDIQEGWDYNRETGEFTAPVIPEATPIEPQPTLEEMQAKTLLNTEVLLAMKNIGV
ncbi:hypothetical protein FCT18_22030 [Lysinibacillus sphaericus]|uniref:Uncharacterized protein n=1 Tax=Lysinibacillus sphaericus TaxID=1421 RepID=A0A2S0K5J6_LYSSH|nr:hypothetical protein [Lysinibacillus sphaericus]AVK98631.1 hypothetical protein LS41612_21060 [Lysinibacillus sphaericus]MED4545916.1 hypothetical protein [Lysinibacillus sphaericus]TKI16029.1 hypothetical protein FCT18_22030 [Lysinibacillus sphaericus]SUV15385.1 Uncharacterised protein [Lysinibacillus sphaericus]GEC84649.1 hypothetical protein LSP03_43920 [Lysinibacillus sphaericus]